MRVDNVSRLDVQAWYSCVGSLNLVAAYHVTGKHSALIDMDKALSSLELVVKLDPRYFGSPRFGL